MAEPVEPPVELVKEASSAMEDLNSSKVTLADLCAKGTAHYAHKSYEAAADVFAQASELQAELNGEMSPDNAEILFLYGRSLFQVGKQQSEILGSGVTDQKKKANGAAKGKKAAKTGETSEAQKVMQEGIAIVVEQTGALDKADDVGKPLFHFTGDENFDDSDDEEAEAEEGEGDEEEQDDLAAAFEVLDLARVLFTKKLEQPEEGAGKAAGDSPMTQHLKERLADTHGLLGEISMENERFASAVPDLRSSLAVKQELYPEESEIIAEAHYMLSLALEFGSIKPVAEDGDDSDQQVDQEMRAEAVKEMKAAINSTKLKLQNKEVELASSNSPDDNDITRAQITEVKEIVAEMEGRLSELSRPPIDIGGMKEAVFGPTSGGNPLGGVLGATLGESPTEMAARIDEAKKNATDVSGLVRHKAKKAGAERNGTNGKRKAEDEPDIEADTKKAKVENAPEVS